MHLVKDTSWHRRGVSLLWSGHTFMASDSAVVSVRRLFALASSWPEDLPAFGGRALIVAGVEACLDALTPADAERWLEDDLRPRILEFQQEYQGGAALIFWLPGGRTRLSMAHATEAYSWLCAPPDADVTIPLGRCIWGGASADASRIISASAGSPADFDGPAWVGLHLARVS